MRVITFAILTPFYFLKAGSLIDYKVLASGHLYEYAYEIKIRNHKDTPVTVVVNEPIGGDWEMISSTFEAKKTAAFAAQFNVPVAKDGEATLTYRVRIRY